MAEPQGDPSRKGIELVAGLEQLIMDALGGGNSVQWSAESAARETAKALLASPDVVLRALGGQQVTAEASKLCDHNGYVVSGPAYVFPRKAK